MEAEAGVGLGGALEEEGGKKGRGARSGEGDTGESGGGAWAVLGLTWSIRFDMPDERPWNSQDGERKKRMGEGRNLVSRPERAGCKHCTSCLASVFTSQNTGPAMKGQREEEREGRKPEHHHLTKKG